MNPSADEAVLTMKECDPPGTTTIDSPLLDREFPSPAAEQQQAVNATEPEEEMPSFDQNLERQYMESHETSPSALDVPDTHTRESNAQTSQDILDPISFAPLPAALQTTPTPIELRHWLQVYLSTTILCNFLLLFFNSHGSDLNFWFNWTLKLTTGGYAHLDADYPPVFLHWLYLAGQILTAANATIEGNDLLKFMAQLPVTGCHCLLVFMIYSLLRQTHATRAQFHSIMLLTVLNPAILFDGPVWSQVDLLPSTLALGAILLCFHHRLAFLAIPLFMVSLLAKFQMICFAPVFAIVFFSRPGIHLVGMALSLVVFVLAFLPFMLVGHLSDAFQNAYIKTLGQYPYSTLNAANLWILVTGNTAPDSTLVVPVSSDSGLYKLVTAKSIGMLSFALFCVAIFAQGLHRLIQQTYLNQPIAFKAYGIQIAMFCSIAFFTLLPAMHERYLFPAVVCSLAYVAITRHKFIYPVLISGISAINMIIIMGVNGSDLWVGLSLLMVFVFLLTIAESALGERPHQWISLLATKLARIPLLSLWVFLLAGSAMFSYLLDRYSINKTTLEDNQLLLSEMPTTYAQQDHDTLQINRSFDRHTLSVGNQRYANGLGTHANSAIHYTLPENAVEFSFIVGLDDEVGSADVIFVVMGDGRELWQSPIIYGNEKEHKVNKVDVRGVKVLELHVYSNGNDEWDHADWIDPIITLSEPVSPTPQITPPETEVH